VLPRASAARTAVEQRGPGHRDPCGVISRQAKHTRSPWASSQESGGAAPVDRCTKRRWDTSDCRLLHPVGEAPSRRAHLDIGQNHIPDGWVVAVVRGRDLGVLGCADWGLTCPSDKGASISMGPVSGGGAFRVPPSLSLATGSGSVSIGASCGSRGTSRVSPCASTCVTSGPVAMGATGGSRGAGPSRWGLACAGAYVLACCAPRGWKSERRAEGGGLARMGGVWQLTWWWGHPRKAPFGGSVTRPACAPPFRVDSREGRVSV